MQKLLSVIGFFVFFGIFGVLNFISFNVQQFVTSFGKTVQVEKISFPEEITMKVGDTMFVPITMTTKDGSTVSEGDLSKICKQYKMVWITSNPNFVLAKKNGELVAKNPGEIELKAYSYNTAELETSTTILIEP